MPALKMAPIAFTTATDGKNVQSVLDLAGEIFKQTVTWIPTAKLNKAMEIIKAERVGATKRNKIGWPKKTDHAQMIDILSQHKAALISYDWIFHEFLVRFRPVFNCLCLQRFPSPFPGVPMSSPC